MNNISKSIKTFFKDRPYLNIEEVQREVDITGRRLYRFLKGYNMKLSDKDTEQLLPFLFRHGFKPDVSEDDINNIYQADIKNTSVTYKLHNGYYDLCVSENFEKLKKEKDLILYAKNNKELVFAIEKDD